MKRDNGFTLLELMTVMIIIAVLAALVLKAAGYAQNKAARSRAASEIAAISTALEGYKADNGEYPHDDELTDKLRPDAAPDNAKYLEASLFLSVTLNTASTRYLSDFPSSSFGTTTKEVPDGFDDAGNEKKKKVDYLYLIDPFGNPYGYSTAGKFNPTYDLWSYSGNSKPTPDEVKTKYGYPDYPAPWWETNF